MRVMQLDSYDSVSVQSSQFEDESYDAGSEDSDRSAKSDDEMI